MKKIIITLLIGILSYVSVLGQEDESFRCSTPEMNEKALKKDASARQQRAKLTEFLEDFEEPISRNEEIYIIPVVFHVVHNYGTENISYEQIEDAIRILNEDYRLQNADTSMIIEEFKTLATDTRIEFRLAKKDPWGNCTNGITRTISYETSNGGEHIKDIAPSWPRSHYLNIWVVRSIPGGVAGYAYYPGTVGDGRDGIILTSSYIGSIGTGTNNRSRTLTHEIGHYLNLPHPWGSTNEPGLSSNCDIDDGIEDTPPTIGHTSCNLYAISCGSLDNVQNYMDYSYCAKMFTHGQGEMMREVLNSSIGERNQLWQESNLMATGVLYDGESEICAPIADFVYDISTGCEGFSVHFTDLSYHTDTITTRIWNFPGGTPESSSERNPQITYNEAGIYNVNLTVINPTDNSSQNKSQIIRVYPSTAGKKLPFLENFESSEFPYSDNFPTDDYYFETNGETGWGRTNAAANSGNYSMRINPKEEPENIKNSFISSAILVDSTDFPLKLNFKYAYSQREINNMDMLKIYVSKNCGQTWTMQYYNSGISLHSANNLHTYSTFIPTSDEWRNDDFEINEYLFKHAENIRFKFELQSKNGNCLYIDDISLQQYNDIRENELSDKLTLYPNPVKNKLYLKSNLPENTKIKAELYDISGRIISTQEIRLTNITDISTLLPEKSKGIFILKLQNKEGVTIKRIYKE